MQERVGVPVRRRFRRSGMLLRRMRPKRVVQGRLAHSIDVAQTGKGAEPALRRLPHKSGRGRPKNLLFERLPGGLNTEMSCSEHEGWEISTFSEIRWLS